MHGSGQPTDRGGVDVPVPGDPVGAVIESWPKPPTRQEFSFRASRQRAANRSEAGTQTDGAPQEGLRRAGNGGSTNRSPLSDLLHMRKSERRLRVRSLTGLCSRSNGSIAEGLPLFLWQVSESTRLLNDSTERRANNGSWPGVSPRA